MNWIDEELSNRRLDEKEKDSSGGTAKKFTMRVRLNGTLMTTAVFAENQRRAKTIGEKLFGKGNVRGLPVRK